MKYAALMFDVIESRKYYMRHDVQKILMNSVDYLNDLYRSLIKKEVVSSAGDEFQGLFLDLQSAYLYIRKLQILVFPIKLRCGIGYGEIKYDVEEWSSSAIDGEAYYLAREAIVSISRKKGNTICFNTKSKYDKYLNELCLSNLRVKATQSQVGHIIDLIADIMLPIVYKEENKNFYNVILERKYELIDQEHWNKVSARQREVNILNVDCGILFDNVEEYMKKKDEEQKFYMHEFWVHGMSTDIARIMNTTRQNIDRYISLGRIKECRTTDKAIYELLGEEIWQNI